MTDDGGRAKRLAARLPDIPRWLEVRSMLLAGTCELFGVDEDKPELVCLNPYTRVGAVVGRPPVEAIRTVAERLAADDQDLLAYEDSVEYALEALPGWTASPAVLHLLADSTRLPRLEHFGPAGMHARPFVEARAIPTPYDRAEHEIIIRFVSGGELSDIEGASERTVGEIRRAALVGKLAATFLDGKPVAFCDASAVTETLWDIGIETLEEHLRQGYAGLSVAYMVDQMGRLGKRPVWGAEESNVPSMRLAARLGFKAADRLIVLNPPV
jgi:RimJ/RimL family protein N-acetyltransferase